MAKAPAEHKGRIVLRVDPDLHDRLMVAARDRGLTMNRLATLALEDYLSRLIPANEVRLTR